MSQLAPFVQRVDCTAHYMNHYPLDPIARDLSSGQQSYFEQLHGTWSTGLTTALMVYFSVLHLQFTTLDTTLDTVQIYIYSHFQ